MNTMLEDKVSVIYEYDKICQTSKTIKVNKESNKENILKSLNNAINSKATTLSKLKPQFNFLDNEVFYSNERNITDLIFHLDKLGVEFAIRENSLYLGRDKTHSLIKDLKNRNMQQFEKQSNILVYSIDNMFKQVVKSDVEVINNNLKNWSYIGLTLNTKYETYDFDLVSLIKLQQAILTYALLKEFKNRLFNSKHEDIEVPIVVYEEILKY